MYFLVWFIMSWVGVFIGMHLSTQSIASSGVSFLAAYIVSDWIVSSILLGSPIRYPSILPLFPYIPPSRAIPELATWAYGWCPSPLMQRRT